MKIWQLSYPHNLQHVTAPDLKRTDDKVKIKITKALLSESDVAVYSGAVKVPTPFIPGRFAIGQVTEAEQIPLFVKANAYILQVQRKMSAHLTACVLQGKPRTGSTAISCLLVWMTYTPCPIPYRMKRRF